MLIIANRQAATILHANRFDGTAPPFGGAAGRALVPPVDAASWNLVEPRAIW
jgi:hypothetical protein